MAFENIVGNVILFMPLGFLLPILFRRLHRPWPMIWRGAAISVAIEFVQLLTRARAVDIDDVILSTLGTALGFAIYRVDRLQLLVDGGATVIVRGIQVAAVGPHQFVGELAFVSGEPTSAAVAIDPPCTVHS